MLQLLKLTLLLVVVIGASIGGTMFFLSKQSPLNLLHTTSASVEAPAPAPLPAPIFAELEPFTVTLRGETRNRILYVAITLRLADEASRKMIIEYMPEVRDRILKILANQTIEQVQTAEGRAALTEALKSTLLAPYAPQPTGPEISDVLFAAFVLQ
ncbi:MAG: flagellar basal body-associated FliL family protein [Alcaligenaceae bacterium]|nr:flagellar basal body-associated FliL family protein [Alcaligenaceae bacterium]